MENVARRPSPVARPASKRFAPLHYRETHPRPPPNKYNAWFGQKCVANDNSTFFIIFDDFRMTFIQARCNWRVQGRSGNIFAMHDGADGAAPSRSGGAPSPGHHGGEGSPRPSTVVHLHTGNLAEQTLGPPQVPLIPSRGMPRLPVIPKIPAILISLIPKIPVIPAKRCAFTRAPRRRRVSPPFHGCTPSHWHLGRASSFAKATEDKDARHSPRLACLSTCITAAKGLAALPQWGAFPRARWQKVNSCRCCWISVIIGL